MERLERALSPKKAIQRSLGRKETWLDVFDHHPTLEKEVRAAVGAQDTRGAVVAIQNLYQKISHEIHNPTVQEVPIPLGLLSYAEAALAVVLCRRVPVQYTLMSEDGVELGSDYTPEQVARGQLGAEG